MKRLVMLPRIALALMVALLATIPSHAQGYSGKSPFEQAVQIPLTINALKSQFNKAVRERGMKGALLIQEFPEPDALQRKARFDQDQNVYLETWLPSAATRDRKINRMELYTRKRGGEYWGDIALFEVALNLMKVLHPKVNPVHLVELLKALQIDGTNFKDCTKSITRTYEGIEYRRLPGDALRRGTLEIRKAS